MNQRAIAYAAVIMSLLVVVAGIGIAADPALEVASEHTTDTDFNAANTLDSVTVSGSGESADVAYKQGSVVDGFEDGDLSEYTGDTTGWTVQQSVSQVGDDAAEAQDNNAVISSSSGLNAYPQAGDTISWWVRGDNADTGIGFRFGVQDANNFYEVRVDPADNDLKILKRDAGSDTKTDSASPSLSTGSWYKVTVTWPSGGGTIEATISDSGGTDLATVSITDSSYTSGDLALSSGPSSGTPTGYVDEIRINGDATGTYISANHSADNVEQGWTDLTLGGSVNATVTWQYWDGSSWQDAKITTYSSSGNKTVSLSQSTSKWRVNVTFKEGGTRETASLASEGVLFNAATPAVNNSSASPNSTTLNKQQVTFEIDANDSDFATAQGDTLTVEFFTNKSDKIGTDTLNSNGTASLTADLNEGGDVKWWVVVTDEYGDSKRSDNFTVTVPGSLKVRNETAPHGLVNHVTVTLKFFEGTESDPTIVERTSNDGTIDLTGLPVGTEFAVTVKAKGYHNRTIRLDDIFEQQSVFILNESRPSIENTFVVEDKTGNYPSSNTRIIVQKAINRSEYGGTPAEFTWTVMAADELGADDSFTVDLEEGDRYRIIVENSQGDQRILGSYDAENGGIVTLTIGEIEVGAVDPEKGYAWEAVFTNESGTGPQATFKFSDKNSSTTSLTLVIFEYGNESNEVYNQTHSGPFGEFKVTTSLPNSTRWVVQFEATRAGETITGKRIIGPNSGYINIGLSQVWKNLASVGLLIVIGGLFGGIRAELGAVIVALMGGILWFVGWLPPAAGGGAVVLALGVSVLMMVRGD